MIPLINKKKKFYISTSIVYASAMPHIGNIYEMVLADAIARFYRLDGYDVYFQTGVDEHGQKIEKKALQKKLHPQEYVTSVSLEIRHIYDRMNISYDHFLHTTSFSHCQTVQKIIDQLLMQGDIYLGKYKGWYSVQEESFVTESNIQDGKTLNGEKLIWTEEDVYFFKLSKYQNALLDYLNNNENLVLPSQRKKEILNLLKTPLMDLSISRTSFKWGIPLNFDTKHIVYVWIDALSNYITGLGYCPNNDEISINHERFNHYWPCNLHVIGKDISRFHLIYWPILLMALKLPLPQKFLIHPWILFNNKKMSKSSNNVLYTEDLLKVFSVDAVRYFLLHEIPYADDGILTYSLLFNKYNSDLVNIIGNLLSRVLGMIEKYRAGKLIKPDNLNIFNKEINLSQIAVESLDIIRTFMQSGKVSSALEHILQIARCCNKYIDIVEPWNLFARDKDVVQLDVCIYSLIETLRFIGVLLKPFVPDTASIILKQIKAESETFSSLELFGVTQKKELFLDKKLFERLNINDYVDFF